MPGLTDRKHGSIEAIAITFAHRLLMDYESRVSGVAARHAMKCTGFVQ